MSDVSPALLKRIIDLERSNERLRSQSLGPDLSDFYSIFRGAPGLRGLWYPGSLDQAGAIYDGGGQGRTLTYNGNPTLNYLTNGVPYMDYDGTGDFHSRPDEAGLDITGLETTIATALRGLTAGGWFWIDAYDATNAEGLMSKRGGSGTSWDIYDINGTVVFNVSLLGAILVSVGSAAGAFGLGAWKFVACRFTPSTEIAMWINGVKTANATGIPASIFNTNAAFEIARTALDSSICLDGRCALAFLAASIWSDALIQHCFVRTRNFFGV